MDSPEGIRVKGQQTFSRCDPVVWNRGQSWVYCMRTIFSSLFCFLHLTSFCFPSDNLYSCVTWRFRCQRRDTLRLAKIWAYSAMTCNLIPCLVKKLNLCCYHWLLRENAQFHSTSNIANLMTQRIREKVRNFTPRFRRQGFSLLIHIFLRVFGEVAQFHSALSSEKDHLKAQRNRQKCALLCHWTVIADRTGVSLLMHRVLCVFG